MASNESEILKQTLAPVSELLDDPDVSDILIFGSYDVYAKRRGQDFNHEEDRDKELLATAIGMKQPIDENDPIIDMQLPDGSRVCIAVAPHYNREAYIRIKKSFAM